MSREHAAGGHHIYNLALYWAAKINEIEVKIVNCLKRGNGAAQVVEHWTRFRR